MINPPKGARQKYNEHHRNARQRGILWEFSFESWWAVWAASGKWEKRGKKKGCYVMSRPGDRGPYSPTNVAIIEHADNLREANVRNRPTGVQPDWLGSYARRKIGTGRGWTLKKDAKARPYEAQFRGTSLGRYETSDEARQAYLAACRQHANEVGIA